MRLLLDTHAFLWFYEGDPQLSSIARELITDPLNDCRLSIVSAWEIGIKTSIGKLGVRGGLAQLREFALANAIELLPITFAHIERLQSLPFHHRDPFDRLLIAQAFAENLTLLTRDGVFKEYGVPALW